MVNALDVADFIVQRCIETKQPISNLKLQKMLYFAWIEYYNKTQERLFNDPFWAWKLGPVVYDVYLSYRVFGAMPISYVPKNDAYSELSTDVKRFLSGFTDSQVFVSGTQLVKKSYRQGERGQKHIAKAWAIASSLSTPSRGWNVRGNPSPDSDIQ